MPTISSKMNIGRSGGVDKTSLVIHLVQAWKILRKKDPTITLRHRKVLALAHDFWRRERTRQKGN